MEAGSWLHRFEWTDRATPDVGGHGYIFLASALSLVGFGIVMGGPIEILPVLRPGPSVLAAFRRIWPVSANYTVLWPTTPTLTLEQMGGMLAAFREIGGDSTPTSMVPGQP